MHPGSAVELGVAGVTMTSCTFAGNTANSYGGGIYSGSSGSFSMDNTIVAVHTLIDLINDVRPAIWARQPADFFELARIDMDGTLVATDAECKQGIDIAYNGVWGYHPLVVSLANTGEVLS